MRKGSGSAACVCGHSISGSLNGKGFVIDLRADEDRLLSVNIKMSASGTVTRHDSRNKMILNAAAFFGGFFSRRIDAVPSSVVYDSGAVEVRYDYGGILLRLDLPGRTEKQISVYTTLLRVPFGGKISYSDLALNSGSPRAARFAGSLMASNSFPVIIPCHRVVRSDGTIGGYTGGTGIKMDLLIHESSGTGGRGE